MLFRRVGEGAWAECVSVPVSWSWWGSIGEKGEWVSKTTKTEDEGWWKMGSRRGVYMLGRP